MYSLNRSALMINCCCDDDDGGGGGEYSRRARGRRRAADNFRRLAGEPQPPSRYMADVNGGGARGLMARALGGAVSGLGAIIIATVTRRL